MKEATIKDKALVTDILSKSFDTNKSVNFVVKQDKKRAERMRVLMKYSFFVGMQFGKVYLSEDRKACCILLFPEEKKTTLNTILWDLKLALNCIGLIRVLPVLKRESLIHKNAPKPPYIHLWYIGVAPEYQNKGIGSKLLKEIISYGEQNQKVIHLETSTEQNLPFYENHGFKINKVLKEEELGYRLYLFRREFKN